MWRTRTLAVVLLALVPSAPSMADSAKLRSQSATHVAAKDVSNAADPSAAAAGSTASPATTTETSSGTTTYFGKELQPAREAAQPLPPPTLTASIDLSNQTMTVSVNGEARYSWPISSGVAQYPTPTGTFYPEWTSKMWYSRKYDWAPMPHAVFINGGVAVHATNAVGRLGNPASHGCIRLSPTNAKTFYNLVERHGLKMTRVTVFGRPNWRGEAIASRSKTREKVETANQGEWLFGNPWGVTQDTAYSPNFTKKKTRGDNAYVYVDGEPTKVSRHKNGEYVYKRKYSNAAAN